MITLIISNALSLIGEISNTILPFLSTKKRMLLLQAITQIVFVVAYAVNGSYVLVALCLIVGLRNLYNAYLKSNLIVNILFLIIGTLISVVVNTNGWLGVLPIICYVDYTVSIMITENPQILRWVLLMNTILYIIFDFGIMMYVCFAFDVFHIVTNSIAIWKYRKE